MNAQSKVYANSNTTVFYDQNLALITKIHDAKEWNPHDLNQYQKGNFLGVTTGVVKTLNGGTVYEIEHSYDHQYKVAGFISKWRPRTVKLFVREDQITSDAPPSEEEKAEVRQAAKQKQNQQLIDSLNAGSAQLTANQQTQSSSGTLIPYLILGVMLIGTLLWALLGRRKKSVSDSPEVIVLPKGKKVQSISAPQASSPNQPL